MVRNAAPPKPQSEKLTVEKMRRGIPRVQQRIDELKAFDHQTIQERRSPKVKAMEVSIKGTLEAVFGHNTVEYNRYRSAALLEPIIVQTASYWSQARPGRSVPDDARAQQDVAKGIENSIGILQQAVRWLEDEINSCVETGESMVATGQAHSPLRDMSKVFVVHGHDSAPKAEVAKFIERFGFEAIILHERPNKGRTLITKFCEEAAGVGFAVVLITPDDLGKAEEAADLKHRARQNVVFELGFFIGKLGPERVAALVKGEIEQPSDFDGVVYISLDKEDWQTQLGSEMQEAGYEIDWNKVMRR